MEPLKELFFFGAQQFLVYNIFKNYVAVRIAVLCWPTLFSATAIVKLQKGAYRRSVGKVPATTNFEFASMSVK